MRTITVGENPSALGVDAHAGHIPVASTNADNQGSVRVLDARSGAVLRTLAVGAQPVAVAVDEQAGRAFVVNYGGRVHEPVAWWAPWVSRLRGWLPPRTLRTLPGWAPQVTARIEPASVSVLDIARA